jgi:hypothetical protein
MIEALVGLGLAGVGVAGLAATGAVAVQGLHLARETASAVAFATERLEALRAGPRADGADTVVGSEGTTFSRRWQVTAGRGRPDRLEVEIRWAAGRRLALTTEAAP